MRSSTRQGKHIIIVLWAAALLQLIECSCMPILPPTSGKAQAVPTVCGTPAAVNSQPEIVQLGLDGLPIYPDKYFHAVLSAAAQRIYDHVQIGSSPMVVFINFITHDSLNQNIMSIELPGLPQLPNKPVLQTSTDPYKAAKLRKEYQTALQCWQKEVDRLQQELQRVQAQVRIEVAKMAALVYSYDPISDDTQGFLYAASQHLASFAGRKFLYIASPMLDNTDVNTVGRNLINFSGVSVSIVDFVCSPASVCVSTQQKFTQLFLQKYKAASINWYLPGAPESSELAF